MASKAPIRTARRRRRFLEVLAECAIVAEACRAAGAARGSFYAWRRDDPEFAAAWDEALEIGIATLEDEAIRRARDGVATPVFHRGRQVATVRKTSDALLMFLLRAHRPQLYRERPRPEPAPRRGHRDASPAPPENVLDDGRSLKEMSLDQIREEFVANLHQQGLAVVPAGGNVSAVPPENRSLLSEPGPAAPRAVSETHGVLPRGP